MVAIDFETGSVELVRSIRGLRAVNDRFGSVQLFVDALSKFNLSVYVDAYRFATGSKESDEFITNKIFDFGIIQAYPSFTLWANQLLYGDDTIQYGDKPEDNEFVEDGDVIIRLKSGPRKLIPTPACLQYIGETGDIIEFQRKIIACDIDLIANFMKIACRDGGDYETFAVDVFDTGVINVMDGILEFSQNLLNGGRKPKKEPVEEKKQKVSTRSSASRAAQNKKK